MPGNPPASDRRIDAHAVDEPVAFRAGKQFEHRNEGRKSALEIIHGIFAVFDFVAGASTDDPAVFLCHQRIRPAENRVLIGKPLPGKAQRVLRLAPLDSPLPEGKRKPVTCHVVDNGKIGGIAASGRPDRDCVFACHRLSAISNDAS